MGVRWRFISFVICIGTLMAVTFSAKKAFAAPSFDCAKATSQTEHAICASPDLSQLDDDLSNEYENALLSIPANEAALKAEQKLWLAKRNKACSTQKTPTDLAACLTPIYQARIDELNDPNHDPLNAVSPCDLLQRPGYGILLHCYDRSHPGNGGLNPVAYASELFDVLVGKEGPLKTKIDKAVNPNCSGCGVLNKPDKGNTVALAYYATGAGNGGTLLRSILTLTDGGSGKFTRPVLALDFEVRYEDHLERNNNSWSTVTVSLTGMADYTDDRLPHVEGLPKPTGCFGCP